MAPSSAITPMMPCRPAATPSRTHSARRLTLTHSLSSQPHPHSLTHSVSRHTLNQLGTPSPSSAHPSLTQLASLPAHTIIRLQNSEARPRFVNVFVNLPLTATGRHAHTHTHTHTRCCNLLTATGRHAAPEDSLLFPRKKNTTKANKNKAKKKLAGDINGVPRGLRGTGALALEHLLLALLHLFLHLLLFLLPPSLVRRKSLCSTRFFYVSFARKGGRGGRERARGRRRVWRAE